MEHYDKYVKEYINNNYKLVSRKDDIGKINISIEKKDKMYIPRFGHGNKEHVNVDVSIDTEKFNEKMKNINKVVNDMINSKVNVNGEARLYINDEFVGFLESTKIELCNDGFYDYKAKVREIEREDTIDGLDDFIKAIEKNMFKEMSSEMLTSEVSKRLVDGINRSKLNENPLDSLYKKEVEGEWIGNRIDMNKIHNLECNKDANICDSFLKLNEEYNEVLNAYAKFDKDNLIEELLDVVQMCYGVAYTIDVDLDEHIKEHNEKLLSRGHQFIEVKK